MIPISIVIPVYNAEKTIADLCRKLILLLESDCHLQIVLINDCSHDGTDLVCKALLVEFPSVITYARLSRNFGEHNAVMAGLNHVRGEYIIIMDDDFQNPPEEVPRLLEEIRKGYDVVYCQYPKKNDSLFRNIGSFLNGTMSRIVLDKPANLYLSSFKAMNRFLVDEVVKRKIPSPYIDAIILRITRNIGTVKVRHDQRRAGRSGYTLKKLAELWGNMLVSYSLIPLRLLTFTGFLLTFLGLYAVADMALRDMHLLLANISAGNRHASVTMFFRGIQLLATGIVGEYVGRIYQTLHQEPQFIIREMSGKNSNESQ